MERIRNVFAGPGNFAEAVTGEEVRRASGQTYRFPQIARGVELGTFVALAVVAAQHARGRRGLDRRATALLRGCSLRRARRSNVLRKAGG